MSYIELIDVSLDFPVYDSVKTSIKEELANSLAVGGVFNRKNKGTSSVRALSEVSFRLEEGDRVALLGHNGAGKTSLLKLLSGFYEPTRGSVSSSGRISALLELMSGMDLQLSGLENIVLCLILHGMSKAKARSKVASIAEFSELGEYLELPVRLYSHGMILRLAFSISTSVECDILLLDEWVGAGDQAFIVKARERLSEWVMKSTILVFATHSPDIARQLCNKAIFLEHGQKIFEGEISEVLAYQEARLNPKSLQCSK